MTDGTLYFDPTNSQNNPIRNIITVMNQPENQKYANNIKTITENTKKINEEISKIIEPKSEFMLLTERVLELSNLLFKLSEIEPKVINVELNKSEPLANKYSWILKPVELNKSEYHGLKGTETLDRLIREDKSMDKFVKLSTGTGTGLTIDLKQILDKLSYGGGGNNLSSIEVDYIKNNISNNVDSFIRNVNATYPIKDALCNIYNSLLSNNNFGTLSYDISTKINEQKTKNNCNNKGQRHQKQPWQPRERW